MVFKDGDVLTLGDTAIKFYVTPGHTPGVLSMEFTVFEGSTAHRAFLFGGANVTSNRIDAFEMFIASVKRLKSVLTNIDVNLASHPWQASILERAERLKSRRPGEPNPFVAPADFRAFLDERQSDTENRLEQARRAR
jgi:metallo-beta-lactamase class B